MLIQRDTTNKRIYNLFPSNVYLRLSATYMSINYRYLKICSPETKHKKTHVSSTQRKTVQIDEKSFHI